MKKYKKVCIVIAAVFFFIIMKECVAVQIFAATETNTSLKDVPDIEIGELKAAENTDQLILVIGQGGYKVRVQYYTKNKEGIWKQVFVTPGVYGKNGSTAKKKEGDGKTPIGTYQFSMAFGLEKDPGSILNYHKITKYDHWIDDSESKYYNQMVDIRKVKKDWSSSEKLYSGTPFYNYALVLNYNSDCVPGKGSAIYLHCTKSKYDTGSAGCIRIPKKNMITLIKKVKKNTNIVIVSDIDQLEYQ